MYFPVTATVLEIDSRKSDAKVSELKIKMCPNILVFRDESV